MINQLFILGSLIEADFYELLDFDLKIFFLPWILSVLLCRAHSLTLLSVLPDVQQNSVLLEMLLCEMDVNDLVDV